jgi:hypothetical protein
MPVRIAARSRASAGQCHGRFDWRAGERQVDFPLCGTDLIHGLFGAHVKAMPHLRRVVHRRVDVAGRGAHFGKRGRSRACKPPPLEIGCASGCFAS